MQIEMNFDYLRTKKAAFMDAQSKIVKSSNKNLTCKVFDNAVIIPPYYDESYCQINGVFDKDGFRVADTQIISNSGERAQHEMDYPFRDETVVFCGPFKSKWGYFLRDGISRLWYSLENDSQVDSYVFSNDTFFDIPQGNYKAFFDLLGIGHKVRFIRKPYRFKRVIIPDINTDSKCGESFSYDTARRLVDTVIRNGIEQATLSDTYERVFLSRSHHKRALRMEPGIEMLDHYFRKNGFHIIHPQEMPLAELIKVLYNASEIASPCGSVAQNILFSHEGAHVIIIDTRPKPTLRQIERNRFKRCSTTFIDGHYDIYPVYFGNGPFLVAYTEQFRRFSADKGFLDPDEYYTSDMYVFKCVDRYMNIYDRRYGRKMGIAPWDVDNAHFFYESYVESEEIIGSYLSHKQSDSNERSLKIRMAGYSIKLEYFTPAMELDLVEYLDDPYSTVDFSVKGNDEYVRERKQQSGKNISPDTLYKPVIRELFQKQVILFHSSAFVFKDKAYLLVAESGGGKSTLAKLLTEFDPSNVHIINDDLPFLRFEKERISVYGSPWCGKHKIGCNMNAPLYGIFILSKDQENKMQEVKRGKAYRAFFSAVRYLTHDPKEEKLLLSMVNRLVNDIPVYQFSFFNTQKAAEVMLQFVNRNALSSIT